MWTTVEDLFVRAFNDGKFEVVEYFIEIGADIEAISENADRKTVLSIASHNGHFEIVKYLVEKGADINALDDTDCRLTALSYASWEDHLEIVKFLVENGAYIDTRECDGKIIATIKGSDDRHRDVLEYLNGELKRREWNQRVKRAQKRVDLGIPLVIESLLIRDI